jgi:cobalt/nickel transport system permease protein
MHPAETERSVSFLHGVGSGTKLLTAMALVSFTALLPRHIASIYLVPFAIVVLLWAVCGMPIRFALKRILIAELFIIGLGVLWFINPAAGPVFLSAFVKSNLCVVTLVLLTWTTPFHELLQQLRRWSFPAIMLTTLALMYRYIPVLGEEARRMSRARASRTFKRRRLASWNNLAQIIGQLFVRTADRAERIYLAMCARGWK